MVLVERPVDNIRHRLPATVGFFVLLILLPLSGCSFGGGSETDPYSRLEGDHLHLAQGQKELFWFSGIHSNDPEHPMFSDLKDAFERFEPQYVLVEGGFHQDIPESSEASKRRGESSYTAYLAREAGTSVSTTEPPLTSQFDYLLDDYEPEAVLSMYLLRQTVQLQREAEHRPVNYIPYMLGYVEHLVEGGFPLQGQRLTEDWLQESLEPHLGKEVSESNWKMLPAWELVYQEEGLIHEIYERIVEYRDQYSASRIMDALDRHDRVFVMKGADHIPGQRRRLEEYFDTLNDQ